MWVKRSPEEISGWRKANEKEARSGGLFIGIFAWAIVVITLSAGWIVSFQSGIALQRNTAGTFWTRLPIIALVASPIIFIASRYESKKALRKAEQRTIRPDCDAAGAENAGTTCQCGGTFVPSSTMKWIE